MYDYDLVQPPKVKKEHKTNCTTAEIKLKAAILNSVARGAQTTSEQICRIHVGHSLYPP